MTEADWKLLIFLEHPDRGGDPEMCRRLIKARAYWRQQQGSCPQCGKTFEQRRPVRDGNPRQRIYCGVFCSSRAIAAKRRRVPVLEAVG